MLVQIEVESSQPRSKVELSLPEQSQFGSKFKSSRPRLKLS